MYFLKSKKFFCTYWFNNLSRQLYFDFVGPLGFRRRKYSYFYYFPFFNTTNSSYSSRFFFFVSEKKYVGTFFSTVSESIFDISSGYFRYIELKGVGFRVLYSSMLNTLYFFLGYNHVTAFKVPLGVNIKVRKQYVLLFSYDKVLLSSTCYMIKSLRFPDPYRGKGVLYKDEILKFKPGKQR